MKTTKRSKKPGKALHTFVSKVMPHIAHGQVQGQVDAPPEAVAAQRAQGFTSARRPLPWTTTAEGFPASVCSQTRPSCSGCAQLRAPEDNSDLELLEQVRQGETQVAKELEHLFYEERLRELGLVSLKKIGLWGGLISVSLWKEGAKRMDLALLSSSEQQDTRAEDKRTMGRKLCTGRSTWAWRRNLYLYSAGDWALQQIA